MSRHGYSDDLDNWDLIRYRGAVASAIRGQRGQAFLRELIATLDAMPAKRLISGDVINGDGEVCAIGAVGLNRGTEAMERLDPDDVGRLSEVFGIAPAMVQELEYENDECSVVWSRREDDPELRWQHMRRWAVRNLRNGPCGVARVLNGHDANS